MKTLLAIAMFFLGCAAAQAQAPTLFGSDLDSAPVGAFVTFDGQNLAGTVTIGGVAATNCPVPPTAQLWFQRETCQVPNGASSSGISITSTQISNTCPVGQVTCAATSNTLPFAVRNGNIYFVSLTGDRAAPGTLAAPWRYPIDAKNKMQPGDITYVRGGLYNISLDQGDGASALYMSNNSGLPGLPKALIGYPGETATIACPPEPGNQCVVVRAASGPSGWWTLAELDLAGDINTRAILDWENGAGGDGNRYVNLKIHGADAVNVVLQGSMNGEYFFGNDDYDYWSVANGAKDERGYGLYQGGYGIQQNIQIDHNRFWNDQGAKGIQTKGLQFYAHTHGDQFRGVRITNNQVLNNCMEGMVVGGTDAQPPEQSWIASDPAIIQNNLIAGNGSCDTIANSTYSGLEMGDGYGGFAAKVSNNTFALNAGGTLSGAEGDVYIFPTNENFDLSQNIFLAQPAGQSYAGFVNLDQGGGGLKAGTLTGSGNAFASNGNPAVAPPSWATATVSTADPRFVNPSLDPSVANFTPQLASLAGIGFSYGAGFQAPPAPTPAPVPPPTPTPTPTPTPAPGPGQSSLPALTWAGSWTNTTAYASGNVVGFNGSSYVSTIDANTGNQPPSSQWAAFALQGAAGIQGIQGAQGNPGPAGAAGANGTNATILGPHTLTLTAPVAGTVSGKTSTLKTGTVIMGTVTK